MKIECSHRRRASRPGLLALALAGAVFALTGCVSAKYKPANKATPPPMALNLTSVPALPVRVSPPGDGESPAAGPSSAEATVHSVIAFRGPGSWKRAAYWDEYVVSVANRGGETLVVESALLTDFRGDPNAPGGDPWLLEKQSLSRRAELNRAAKTVLVQFGSGYLVAGVSGAMMLTGGFVGTAAGAYVGVALFPAYIVGAVVRNINSRHHIEAEFARRRLALPAIVPPGSQAEGSLFFRISPGPQRLAIRYRIGHESRDLVVDLAPLAGLHLKPADATPESHPALASQP